MSQVSPVKLLGNQMAGLTEVGSICCCTHCPCYLLYFPLPVDVLLPCVVILVFQCYLPFCRPFQMWIPFCNSLRAFALLGTLSSRKAADLAGFIGSLEGFCFKVTSLARLYLSTPFTFTTHPSPPPSRTLIFLLCFLHHLFP